jgi:hypothetical protein
MDHKNQPLHCNLWRSIVLPLLINPLLILIYGGVTAVTWFHKNLAQVTNSDMGYSLTITQDVCA